MKKNLGSVVGLYPTPVAIIGTEIEGKVNWMNVAHLGIWGMDKMLLSIAKGHYTNTGLKENKTVSVNMVDKGMLAEADYVGMVSGKKVDKSDVFEYFNGELKGAPLIHKSPIAMECEIVEVYETETYDHCIVKPVNTYADEEVLSDDGKIDYEKAKPILFEMHKRQYLSTGNAVAKCWDIGKEYTK
ncbi:MAG: flavin reductase family protein [Maledivibacter sp.]|nr:flavin reductase family protein [Maledivibacter sp.]